MSFFSVRNISAGYGASHIVRNVSFSMENGCVMGILGANGSGKTTLIKAVCGILPHTGTCILDRVELEKLTPRQIAKFVSFIPQRSGISIDISALDVVLMGFNPQLGLLEHPTKAMKDAAIKALAQVGMNGNEQKNYLHLSEGQKQLCILARTIVSGSKLLLLDEPESALDFRYRYQMLDMIRHWANTTKGGSIITLHDPVLALNYCDKLMLLHDGGILDILSPSEDTLDTMEQMLSYLYGPISLQWCLSRRGEKVLIMLKEDER